VSFALLGLTRAATAQAAEAAGAAGAAQAAGAVGAGGERTVVVIVADRDVQLSDDLTEVAIARMAERRDREVIGIPELRPRLRELAATDDLAGCVADLPCLAKLGKAAGAGRALGGTVALADSGFSLKLLLVDIHNVRQEAEVSVSLPRDQGQLIAALQTGVDRLLRIPNPVTKRALGTIVSPAADKPETPSLSLLHPSSNEGSPRAPRNFASYVAYGAGVLAVASLVAAIVTGTIATGKPSGDNRRDAQADLERREDYASASTALWITSGLFSGVAVGALTWRWRAP
jgi:hypothetical protein